MVLPGAWKRRTSSCLSTALAMVPSMRQQAMPSAEKAACEDNKVCQSSQAGLLDMVHASASPARVEERKQQKQFCTWGLHHAILHPASASTLHTACILMILHPQMLVCDRHKSHANYAMAMRSDLQDIEHDT
jgi:hypothetical protein